MRLTRLLLAMFSGITGLLLLFATLVYRFRNPELTETQLFLKHWTWYVVIVCLLLIAKAIFPKDNEEGA